MYFLHLSETLSHAAFAFLDDDLLALIFVRKGGLQEIIGCAKHCMQPALDAPCSGPSASAGLNAGCVEGQFVVDLKTFVTASLFTEGEMHTVILMWFSVHKVRLSTLSSGRFVEHAVRQLQSRGHGAPPPAITKGLKRHWDKGWFAVGGKQTAGHVGPQPQSRAEVQCLLF